MALPMAAWRLSYTTGRWLALSGPTSLVIMMAPPASVSGLVADLWKGTLETRTPDALFQFIADEGISNMPHFGAFFWDSKGLHGISRGDIQIVDADTGEVAIEGSGSITWQEDQLDADRTYTIKLEADGEEERTTLPLVVGAALVSSVTLTTAKDQQLRFPSSEQMGVLGKIPVLGLRPRQRRAVAQRAAGAMTAEAAAQPSQDPTTEQMEAVDVAPPIVAPDSTPEAPAPSAPASAAAQEPAATPEPAPEPQPVAPDPTPEQPAPSPVPQPEAAPEQAADDGLDADTDGEFEAIPFDPSTLSEVPSATSPVSAADLGAQQPSQMPPVPAPGGQPSTYGAPMPGAPMPESPLPQAPVPTAPNPMSAQSAAPYSAPSAAPMSAPSGRSAPVVVPGQFGEVEEDEGTIFSTGLAATHKPAAPEAEPEPQVLAVPCAQGHPNPQGARSCRICQAPVDASNPRLVRRPVLAGVNTNHGEFADIVSAVIVGRSPDLSHGPSDSYLMRVPSPGNDISRNHVKLVTKDWNVVVTDLHSTNGTTVKPVGEPEFELRDGRSVQVELGTILDLGDGVSLRIEPPRGR